MLPLHFKNKSTSEVFHRLLPPKENGLGSLPADNNRHAVRGEIDSLLASVLHETAAQFSFVIKSAIFYSFIENISFTVTMTAFSINNTTKTHDVNVSTCYICIYEYTNRS